MADRSSLMPRQAPPVKRPQLIQPHTLVDIENGHPDDLFAVFMALLHGGNINAPAAFDHLSVARQSSGCCQHCLFHDTGVTGGGGDP